MSKLTECAEQLDEVVAGAPLVYRRRIGWADTDAARITYTVRFFEFGMAAAESWFRNVWGKHWYRMHVEHDVGTPFVHIDMDIHASLIPEDIIEVRVFIEKLGGASLTFDLRGCKDDGTDCFTARYVCTLVHMNPIRAMKIPADKRALIEDYIAWCDARDEAFR